MKKTILSMLLSLAVLLPASAQRNLSGRITDSSGEPLPGASIRVVGTQAGFITDAEGRYEIRDIRFPAKVVISYLGYADTELDRTTSSSTIPGTSSTRSSSSVSAPRRRVPFPVPWASSTARR